MQRWFAAVKAVQVAHHSPDAFVRFERSQCPVDFGVMVPLGPLTNFRGHELQFFSWRGVLPGEQQS